MADKYFVIADIKPKEANDGLDVFEWGDDGKATKFATAQSNEDAKKIAVKLNELEAAALTGKAFAEVQGDSSEVASSEPKS